MAPPDHHLTVIDGVMAVARGPREHGFRPAIDPLFRSAAKEYRERVVGTYCLGRWTTARLG